MFEAFRDVNKCDRDRGKGATRAPAEEPKLQKEQKEKERALERQAKRGPSPFGSVLLLLSFFHFFVLFIFILAFLCHVLLVVL